MVHILLWDEQFSEKIAQLTELIFSELQSAHIISTHGRVNVADDIKDVSTFMDKHDNTK
jgi:hypothetical protein